MNEIGPETNSFKGIRFINNNSQYARGTTVTNGMLEFSDLATFKSTIESLAQQEIDYDDAFLAKYGALDDEQLEAKEEEIGHDVHQPYIDFENQFNGFTSLRKDITDRQKNLINNQTLNDSNEPDDHYIFDDEVRAVLNKDAQVKINKSLYQMTNYGYVEITDGNFATLALVAAGDASELNLPNIDIEGGYYGCSSCNQTNYPPTGCRTDITERNYKTTSNKRRIKGTQKLKGFNAIWGTKIKSKTKYQKKRSWGGWTSKRTNITATITGESVNEFCNLDNPEHKTKTRRKRKVKVKITGPTSYVYKTEYHKLKTIHKKVNNNNIIDDYFYE